MYLCGHANGRILRQDRVDTNKYTYTFFDIAKLALLTLEC
jgi:hypothetical protein